MLVYLCGLNLKNMKKLIMASLFALVTIVSFGQNYISDTLDCSKVNDIEWSKKYKNNEMFYAIKLKDGSVLKVGDAISLGKPTGTNTIAQKNMGLLSGSVSTTTTFQYVMFGRIGLSAMMGAQYLPSSFQNVSVRIKEIKGSHTSLVGSRNSPLSYWLILDLGTSVASVLNIDLALVNGELINPNRPLNRTEAIAKLKEQKDLLDLGMVTKDDFDKLKDKLSPIINSQK